MKKFLMVLALMASPIMAQESICYELSSDGQTWSRTAEVLCVATTRNDETGRYDLTLAIDDLGQKQVVATFSLDMIRRLRCIDCNGDVFGLKSPSNSVFNSLKITFNGRRELVDGVGVETGTVKIGKNKFFYRTAQ